MGILKKLGTWLVMGLFIGTGLTVAMYGVGSLMMVFYMDSAKLNVKNTLTEGEIVPSPSSSVSFESQYKEFSSEAGLVITSHNERKVKNSVDVLGVVENKGVDTWTGVNIEVELFDKNGKFVDECNEYMSGRIKPGEKKNFKVSCRRCDKNPLPEYNNYTIVVNNAHFQRKK